MFTSLPASSSHVLEARVDLRDALDLPAQLRGGDVVAEAVRGRVVGDRQVLVAARPRRLRHLRDRGSPVGGDRVAVQVAADVRQLDQGRRLRVELAAVLAQLGLDVGEAEQLVHLGLGRALPRRAARVLEDPVLRDVPARAHRACPQRRVVGPRAGEVLQQVPELRRRRDAQVDGDARVSPPAGAGGAAGGGHFDLLQSRERLRERLRLGGDRDEVHVLHALRSTPRRAGDLYLRVRGAACQQTPRKRLA